MNARPWPNPIVDLLADLLGGAKIGEIGYELVAPDRWSVDRYSVQRFTDKTAALAHGRLLERLGSEVPVGAVVRAVGEWLVTVRPSGQPIGKPELHAEPGGLAPLMGESLRLLHRVNTDKIADELALASGWSALVDQCRHHVASGRVEAQYLGSPYDRHTPNELLAMLDASRPEVEELVLCHGLIRTDDVLVDAGTFSGFDGLDHVIVADRHLDLALAHLGIHNSLGAEAVFAMYDGYGLDADLLRLDHYMMMGALLMAGFGFNRPAADPVINR